MVAPNGPLALDLDWRPWWKRCPSLRQRDNQGALSVRPGKRTGSEFYRRLARFVLTLLLVRLALNSRVSDVDLIAGMVGLFLIGLFHAWIGAFGRK
jgi:hypothetical protein